MSDEPQTEAGKQAAADKEAAAKLAAADQAEAAKQERRARSSRNSAPMPAIDQGPCEECAAHTARLEQLEARVAAIGKLVSAAVIAAVVIYFLSGSREEKKPAEVE